MSFKIKQPILLEGILKANPIVPSKSTLQILTNLKLQFSPEKLVITATDLDHFIRIELEIEGEGEHNITINSRKLLDIVRELSSDDITLSIDENVLIIDSGSTYSAKISGADSRDFPQFPEITESTIIEVDYDVLKNSIKKSSFAVSTDEARACLCGVLWEIENEKNVMVATDGHRLGYSSYNTSVQVENKIESIISPKSLLHAVKIFENDERKLKVEFGDKYIVFSDASVTLCTKLIDGPYPDYDKVIPKNNPKNCIIDRKSLIEAVKRVSVLSNQKTHLLKFSFREGQLEIAVSNRDIGGEARQIVDVDYSNEEHIIGYNGVYLSEILGIINTNRIRIEMNTQISACLIYPVIDDGEEAESSDVYLIMPLKILDDI